MIRNWAKGARGLEVPGSQPSLIIPASLSGQEPSLHRPLLPWHAWAWGLLMGLQPFLTGDNGLPACTLQILQNTPQRRLALPAHPTPWSPSGSTQVTSQGFAELGQPLLDSRTPSRMQEVVPCEVL